MNFLYPLLLVLLTVFATAPLQYPGAFQSHSGLLPVYNLINLDQNPLQFVTWAPTVGHAFDVFRSEGALPYLIAEAFHLIGWGYLDSIKLVFAIAWIASGLTMYSLARHYVRQPGALIAAIIYIYLPYHVATVYVRGAFAESVAWAVFPLALQSLADWQSPQFDWRRILPLAALVLIQPGLTLLFAAAAFFTVAIFHWRTRVWVRPVLTTLLGGLALGLIAYLPVLLRHGATSSRDGFSPNFVLPFQLFSAAWGFGPSTGSFLDKFPLQIGVVPVGLVIVAVALAWQNRVSETVAGARRALGAFLVMAVVVLLLTLEISAPFWKVFGFLVTYPWQLLAFAGLAIALAAGTAIEFDVRLTRPAMLAAIAALPVMAVFGYLAPRYLEFAPTRPQIATFGNDEIALLDYRIVGPLRHGATVRLQLMWQALRPVDHDYTVFVHAVHEDGRAYAQEDSRPQDGAQPTIKWTPGQVISDTHTIQIDVDGPRDGYHLEVGLYQSANGNRAILDTGADQLILPRPGDPEPVISDQLPVAKKP